MNDIVARTRTLIGRHATLFLVTVTLLTAVAAAADTMFPAQGSVANLASSVASFVALAAVNRNVVRADHPAAGDDGLRLAHLFGLCLLTNIGIALGLLLLIVPGLYLTARWSISVPLLYAEDMDIGPAMRASAERTRAQVWPIAGLFLLLYLPAIVIVIATVAFEEALPALSVAIVVNLALYATMVTGWFFALALYAALDPRPDRLAEVFA